MENEERTYTIDADCRRHLVAQAFQAMGETLHQSRAVVPDQVDAWTFGRSAEELLTLADAYDAKINVFEQHANIKVEIINSQINFRVTHYIHSKNVSPEALKLYETHNAECCADPQATQPEPMTAGYL